MFYSNSKVGEMVHTIVIHISFLCQMFGNLQTIMLLLYTFVLPANPIDPGKKVLISLYTSKYRKIKGTWSRFWLKIDF